MLTLDDAVATARTGDIWLFRGRSFADRAIQTMTNSPVNHVGMVVALDDLQPLMFHAELGKSLPDVWTGERQRGVQLHILRDAVTTWDTRYGQRAWVTLTEERDVLCISIDDNGPGIAAPDIERVFEPFVRLEASGSHETGGVGLGMTIARSIVRGHGGDITLTNRPEGGLRVAVHVPIVLAQ